MKYIFYLLGVVIGVGLLIIFLAAAIEIFIFRGLKAETGTIGDTFGGLLSPVIGVISIYFIYRTFETQREQLKIQKEQFDISTANEIINSRTIKIDNIIKSQAYKITEKEDIEGELGLIFFNNLFDREYLKHTYRSDYMYEDLKLYIGMNFNPFLAIIDYTASTAIVLENLLKVSNINEEQKNDIRTLFVLGLNRSFINTIHNLNQYFSANTEEDVDTIPIFAYDINRGHLRMTTSIIINFFNKVSFQSSSST